MKLPLDITIAIPVKNEEKNLEGCFKSIGENFVKKIVVVDSGSTDATKSICAKWGIEVVDFVWNGQFPKKRNWLLRNYKFDTEWVLFLDADEYLNDAFKNELEKKIQTENKVGYWLNYTIFFLGENLKGGYPLAKLALFKVNAGEYERIDEQNWSKLDMEIHEHPILTGETGVIKSKIDHLDYRGISHYFIKHNEYSSWEANRYLKTINDLETVKKFTFKQKIKYKLVNSVWIGPLYFLGSYFLLGGFRDGKRGFAFAILKSSYFVQVYCKIQENLMAQKNLVK